MRLCQQSNACLFSPSPLVSSGQRGSGLPLAPWALLLCWWSPELETHSKGVLLRGELGAGRKMPSGRSPRNTPAVSYGAQHRGPISPTVQNTIPELHSGKFNSPRGTNHSRNVPLLSKATLAFFSPSPLVSRGHRGSGLLLAPWALLLCWWSPELETHSKGILLRGEAGVGTKMPPGCRPQQSPWS